MTFSMRAARATRGATSLSIASHFPVMLASYNKMPVKLPPGRAKLVTNPEPIGSEMPTNTIGMARVSRWSATAT